MRKSLSRAAACAALLALSACQDHVVAPAPVTPPAAQPEFHTGYIQVDGDVWEVRYEIRNGRAIYQGDIDLGPADRVARTREEVGAPAPGGARLGVIHNSTSRRWPDGVVPYVIESTVGNPNINAAISHIEQSNPGVNLVPRTSQSNYVIFRRTTDPDICGSSQLGRVGGGQLLLIKDNASTRCVVHELGHALGMWHEQSRCDRDSYIQIDTAMIMSGRLDQFAKHCSDGDDIGSYDEYSIMHYHKTAFGITINNVTQQTIYSLRGLDAVLGTGSTLSTGDVYTLDWMYPPPVYITYMSLSMNYHPIVEWNAVRTATHYELYMIEEEDYRDVYGTTWSDTRSTYLGSTTSLQLEDPYNEATGKDRCDYSTGYAEHVVDYTYELVAHFPSGLTRTDRIGSQAAPC